MPVEADGFLGLSQSLLAAAKGTQHVGEVIERHRQVRQERVGSCSRQLPAEADGFLGLSQSLLAPPKGTQHVGEVIERHRQVRQERVGSCSSQLPVEADGFLRQSLVVAPKVTQPDG